MVVIFLPATALIGVRHARVAAPSMCTVQAPHRAMPHPNFVPVIWSTSRRYQSRGICGSPSNACGTPFTVSVTMVSLLEVGWTRAPLRGRCLRRI